MGTVVAIILAVILGILIGAIIYGNSLAKKNDHYDKIYTQLMVLDYFVRNCSINAGNASSIEDNLKKLRADKLMEEEEICDAVDRVNTEYLRRFKQVLQ